MKQNSHKPPIKAVADVQRPRSWVIYGRSGAGKTTFASTFPKPALLLDVRDKGTDSVADVKSLDVWEIEDWEDFEDVFEFLVNNPTKYKTLIVDTVTQMQNLCLEFIMHKKRKSSERVGDWGTMSRREWGDASASMKEKITTLRDLNMEVVFIAQEKTTSVEEGEESDPTQLMVPEVGPAAMKSVTGHLNASVSIIGNAFIRLRRWKEKVSKGKTIEMEEAVHCLRLGAHPVYVTKTRKPKSVEVSDHLEDPSYKDVIEILSGK